jgi:stage IV sporulation protein A
MKLPWKKGRDEMTTSSIYQSIATRTAGDIYIGVVGPVRTGKSTFIKRFMETQVIPNIDNVYRRERARDELPQSGSGRTIMTAEPKFVPEEAVQVQLPDGAAFSVRLIDCVGYMVKGAIGQTENDAPRMVTTPWFDHEIPMTEAAELGTRKVIAEHSTIGIVVTTDGTISDIPREDYLEAEERVIRELQELKKPFIVLLNSSDPQGERAAAIGKDIASRYDVKCMAVNCLTLADQDVAGILRAVLYEFPMQEMDLFLPPWVDALPPDHPIKSGLYTAVRESTAELRHIREVDGAVAALAKSGNLSEAKLTGMDLGTGIASVELRLPRELFYKTLSEQSGFEVGDDGDLMSLLTRLAGVKTEYDKVAGALRDVRENGYGIVVPGTDELKLEEPEIVRQGGRYGVRLRASAPSIHMIRADIETSVSPIVGSEKQSEDMVNYLLQEFEGDTSRIWESNIFGRSFHELVSEDLQSKLKRMPDDARKKLQETLTRIINEGSGGLICIIL